MLGCGATIAIGMEVLAAAALGDLLSIFREASAPRVPPDRVQMILPLAPAAAAVAANFWILWLKAGRAAGHSPWWLVPALAISAGTLLLGAWVCFDVWPRAPLAAA